MKNILIHIATWIVAFWVTAFMCTSCGNEHIDSETMIVVGEERYNRSIEMGNSNIIDEPKSLYTIKYKSRNINAGLTIYVVADADDFEVGDKVKLIKDEN